MGFPGETEEQFNELLDFVKWARFDAAGCFTFFAEQGTDAAEMPDQVPDEIKQHRLETLMLTQQKIAFEKNEQKIGAQYHCLVDSIDENHVGQARYYGQAQQVDSVCLVGDCTANPGEFIEARVAETSEYDLVVEQI